MNKYVNCDNPFFRHIDNDRRLLELSIPDTSIKPKTEGQINEALNFIVENQLIDRESWKKFVEQFREKSDSATYGWRCEYWGKMMRGAAFVCSLTDDARLYSVLEETVRDLLTARDPDGRFSTYTVESEFNGWDMWGRKYILLSLGCFYPLCRDESLKADILGAMKAHADYIVERVGSADEGKLPIWKTSLLGGRFALQGAMNSLSVLEPIVMLYRMTGEEKYLDFAEYLVEDGAHFCGNIFEWAADNSRAPYEYPYTKAYEMMSCFEGLLEYAKVTSNDKWKQAVINFAYRMLDTDVTVIGNAGTNHEFLDHSAIQQSIVEDKQSGQETCVAVTWMKFCSRMLVFTGDTVFADCFEQTLYNAYMGALNTEKKKNPERLAVGMIEGKEVVPTFLPFDSYTPLVGGVRGEGIGGSQQFSDGSYYGCCACIGAVGIGIAPRLVLMRSGSGFAFQLYEKGVYTASTESGAEVRFTVDTAYPKCGEINITVEVDREEAFPLSLRIPSWSLESSLCLNGNRVNVTSGATTVERSWQSGDKLTLNLDMRVEAIRPTPFTRDILRSNLIWSTCEAVPTRTYAPADHMEKVAFRRGPVILAQDARVTSSYPAAPLVTSKSDCYLEAEEICPDSVGFNVALKVAGVEMIDVASAGRTWDESSHFTVWTKAR